MMTEFQKVKVFIKYNIPNIVFEILPKYDDRTINVTNNIMIPDLLNVFESSSCRSRPS